MRRNFDVGEAYGENNLYGMLVEKWSPLLDDEKSSGGRVRDKNRRMVTAVCLENQERENEGFERTMITESIPSTNTQSVQNWNPVLISLVRRTLPNLIAHDVIGVQPMTGPTGLIFALRSRYGGGQYANREALYNEADTQHSGKGTHDSDNVSGLKSIDSSLSDDSIEAARLTNLTGRGKTTYEGEQAEWDSVKPYDWPKMGFTIEQQTVTAVTRNLAADYSLELAQDLKAIHGLDAKTELANILSTEIVAEINREIIRTINSQAITGAQTDNVEAPGLFDLTTDTDGRWSIERYKGMLMQINRECNQIAKDTRRGKGNWMITSSDVASALEATHLLDWHKPMTTDLDVDDTGNTFAGVINGRMKVYIDPYTDHDYCVVGYKGAEAYDAGLFYCPYVPLTMVQAVSEGTFQPRLGFKTRYGLGSNPFVFSHTASTHTGLATAKTNYYFRIFRIDNIMS